MIHLSDIIKAIGGSEKDYPDAQVRLFDGKGREVTTPTVEYVAPLFQENAPNKEKFEAALQAELQVLPTSPICMQINADAVVLNYRTPKAKIFMRKKPLDSIDYME